MKGFRVVAITLTGKNSFKHLEKANIQFKIIAQEPLTYEFVLNPNMYGISEGNVRFLINSVLKLWGAYLDTDYKIEVF